MEIKGEELSILGFIEENKIVNERGERLDFYNRPFLLEPLCDRSRFQCYKKAAQGIGMSTMMSIKTFYSAMYDGYSSIHTFPTDDDSREFVKTKVNKMLQGNACFKGIQSDNVELKEIGDRFIYYQGTISKSGALSKTADILVQDEKDRSDQQKLKDLESRTINSKFKGVWSLSNPSVDGAGVDEDWNQSDKKEWLVECSNGHKKPMVWPESVDIQNKRFVCNECGITLSDDERRYGDWYVFGDPERKWDGTLHAKWSGWHMTLLFCPLISAEYIIEQWDEGKNPEYFNNFILGEPYSPGDTKIERHTIIDNWTPKNIDTGRYFLGVDVGNIKHYVLGSEKGIMKVGTFTEWHKLDEILARFGPTSVMDAMPENTMAHHYKDTKENFFICHFSSDKENNSFIRWGENDKQGIVFADRNRLIDHVVTDLLDGKILYSLPSDRDFRDYLKHCGDLRRVKETNNRGIEKYIWDSLTGEDHYFFATLYWWIAKQTFIAGATEFIGANGPPQAVIQTKDGFRLNVQEVLEYREIYGKE